MEHIRLSQPPTDREIDVWFHRRPTLSSVFDLEDSPSASLMGVEFLEWYNIYARNHTQCAYICHLADSQDSCPALAWCWMTSEFMTNKELCELLLEGAAVFHAKAGYSVYGPEHCHRIMALCVQAIEIEAEKRTRDRAMRTFARQHLGEQTRRRASRRTSTRKV